VVLCEAMGLWAVAHADGTVLLRMLPAGALAERQTLALARGAPPAVYNDSEFRAPFLARIPRTPDAPQGWCSACACLLVTKPLHAHAGINRYTIKG